MLGALIWSGMHAQAASAYDQLLVHHEIQASAYESGLARLGLARALRPEVRAYAETVIDDQAHYNEALRNFAQVDNLLAPAGMGRRDRQRLDRLGHTPPGNFDAAYLREARRIHGDGIRALRTDASRTADPELGALLARYSEVGKTHQSLARALSNTVLASRAAVIHPPRTDDPMVVPGPGDRPMPVIQPPSDPQHGIPTRN